MVKNEREREIVNILKERHGFVTVGELCAALYASESSVRRDLTALEEKGIIRRSYGGAELITVYTSCANFNHRTHHNADAKKIIAAKAASLIKDGDVIFLDQSSTSFFLANELLNNRTLTVVSNNIEIINLLSGTEIKTMSSGGTLSSENRMCLVGADAQYIFDRVCADIVFFSAKSLTDDGVICDCNREEVLVREAMIRNAARKVFLCDSEKFGTRSAYKQCDLGDVDILVSESPAAVRYAEGRRNLQVI